MGDDHAHLAGVCKPIYHSYPGNWRLLQCAGLGDVSCIDMMDKQNRVNQLYTTTYLISYSDLRHGPIAGFCEHSNQPSSSMRNKELVEQCHLLGYNAVQSIESQPAFRRNISPFSACHLLSHWLSWSACSLTLKMEAICSSRMLADFQRTTWRYITEDGTFHNYCCENLKSYKNLFTGWYNHHPSDDPVPCC
jgi:hypothetical protein